jgi:Rho-binding antiterminator
MSDSAGYHPIDCGLHDRLEALATLRRRVRIEYRAEPDAVESIDDRIADIVTRDGAEYLRTETGLEIRLDALVRVDGVGFDQGNGTAISNSEF